MSVLSFSDKYSTLDLSNLLQREGVLLITVNNTTSGPLL